MRLRTSISATQTYRCIRIQNLGWLKTAALYYTKLFRIVPNQASVSDDQTTRTLIDELGFVDSVDALGEAERISNDFVRTMRQKSPWPRDLPPIFNEHRNFKPAHYLTRIHVNKLTLGTLTALAEMGLAEDYRRMKPNQRWIQIEPRAAAIYMTMLAERMAERRGIPTVTDDPLFQDWVRHFGLDPLSEPEGDREFRLPYLVIQAAVPRGVGQVPVRKIIEFRRAHDAERLRFFAAIDSMSRDIATVQDQQALEDCLRQHQEFIADAVSQLRKAIRGVRIETVAGLLGISLPPLIAQVATSPSAALIAGGISVAAAVKSLAYAQQYAHIRDSNPWNYVLSLSRVDARGFLESAARGDLLI